MKKIVFTLLLFLMCAPSISFARDECQQGGRPKLSPTEFRNKQKEFITRDANLTDEEAAKFFPLYYELQDKKKAMNDKSWNAIRQSEDDNLSESQYKSILESIYNTHIAVDRLEKEYFYRYRKILSYKKILRVHRAEMRFSRFLIRNMRNNAGNQ
jgi:hypothetical protein